jgi:Concanavalin A-like lectin/glucanases superfamily
MIKQLLLQYLRKLSFCGFMVISIIAWGCNCNNQDKMLTVDSISKGAASIDIKLGKIGKLAKTSAIVMDKLIIEIGVANTSTIFLRDTLDLAGMNGLIFNKTYSNLTAPLEYSLTIRTVDTVSTVIHSGSTTFTCLPGDTANVLIDLDAQYSMMKASFNNIPDNINSIMLGISGIDTISSSFETGTEDSLALEFDYITADSIGISHHLTLKARGVFFGKDTVLYSVDTNITATSGLDNNYQIEMNWVGPETPNGAASIQVSIGRVGTTFINAGFENKNALPVKGLIAYYPFSGNAFDSSGNTNNGNVTDAVLSTDRFGHPNQAYQFNGTSAYIDIPDADILDPSSGLTIAMWVKPDTIPELGSFLLCKHRSSYNSDGSWWIAIRPDGIVDFQATPNFNGQSDYSAGLNKNEWTFVCFTYNDTTQTWLGYSNGVAVDSGTVNFDIVNNDKTLLVGAEAAMTPETTQYHFDGTMDDIRLYSRPLKKEEVLTLYKENGWNGNR